VSKDRPTCGLDDVFDAMCRGGRGGARRRDARVLLEEPLHLM
jgi:hypothetical protein